ncbi:hypothetical protein ACE6H2_021352 [Prunus campanulata]
MTDKLVSGRGTLVKVSTVKPLVVQMDFRCVEVQDKHCTHISERKFSPPSKCDLDGWKSRNFNPIRSTAQTIDFQKIRIQELLKPGDHEDGRVPHTVECELLEDLVDACIPGDVVTVTGIMRVINNYMYGSGDPDPHENQNQNQKIFLLLHQRKCLQNQKIFMHHSMDVLHGFEEYRKMVKSKYEKDRIRKRVERLVV